MPFLFPDTWAALNHTDWPGTVPLPQYSTWLACHSHPPTLGVGLEYSPEDDSNRRVWPALSCSLTPPGSILGQRLHPQPLPLSGHEVWRSPKAISCGRQHLARVHAAQFTAL